MKHRKPFSIVSQAAGLSLIGLTAVATSPALAICEAPQTFAGSWQSSWDNGDGTTQYSPIHITTTSTGITGTYNGGNYYGGYINGNRKEVVGRWTTTGGGCQFGRFQFSLINGRIVGKWGCGSEGPNKVWNADRPCNDTNLRPGALAR
jgi:hypothetical protein